MAYKYFEKGSIYHSDLRKVTEDGTGISFMLTSDMKMSRNKKDQIVKIKPYGDDDDYWYQAENEQIAAVLAQLPRDQWLICKAHGDRDNAYLELTDVDGKPLTSLDAAVDAQQPTPPAPPPPAAPAPLPHQPTGAKPSAAPASTMEQFVAPLDTPPNEPQVPAGVPQVQDRHEKVDDSMLECLCRAHEIVGRFAKLHDDAPPSDLVQRVGVSLFIEGH